MKKLVWIAGVSAVCILSVIGTLTKLGIIKVNNNNQIPPQ